MGRFCYIVYQLDESLHYFGLANKNWWRLISQFFQIAYAWPLKYTYMYICPLNCTPSNIDNYSDTWLCPNDHFFQVIYLMRSFDTVGYSVLNFQETFSVKKILKIRNRMSYDLQFKYIIEHIYLAQCFYRNIRHMSCCVELNVKDSPCYASYAYKLYIFILSLFYSNPLNSMHDAQTVHTNFLDQHIYLFLVRHSIQLLTIVFPRE